MIKLKFLIEKKKEKKEKEPAYPKIIMLPDVVMERDKFIKFLNDVYNADVKFKNIK